MSLPDLGDCRWLKQGRTTHVANLTILARLLSPFRFRSNSGFAARRRSGFYQTPTYWKSGAPLDMGEYLRFRPGR
jgi:hypothetical protein